MNRTLVLALLLTTTALAEEPRPLPPQPRPVTVVSDGSMATYDLNQLDNLNPKPLKVLRDRSNEVCRFESPDQVSLDPVHDQLLVNDGGTVLAFPRTARGPQPPARSWNAKSNTEPVLDQAVDEAHGELVHVTAHEVKTYDLNGKWLRTLVFSDPSATPGRVRLALDPVHNEILVGTNETFGSGVRAYPRLAHDRVEPLRTLHVPGHLGALACDPIHGQLVVTNDTDLLVYPRQAQEDAPPLRRLTLSEKARQADVVLADPAHREVTLMTPGTIFTWSSKTWKPVRSLTLPPGAHAIDAALDAKDDELVLLCTNPERPAAVLTYPRKAAKAVPPTRILGRLAALPGLENPTAIAGYGGFVWIASAASSSLLSFPKDAGGEQAPTRRVPLPAGSGGFAYDPGRREFYCFPDRSADRHSDVSVVNVDGHVLRSFTLDPRMTVVHAAALDLPHDEVLIAGLQADGEPLVLTYPRATTGTTSPTRVMQPRIQFKGGGGYTVRLAVDSLHEETILSCYSSGQEPSVNFYPRSATGSTPPSRMFFGDGIPTASAIAYDPNHDDILLGGSTGGLWLFPRLSSGVTAPIAHMTDNAPPLNRVRALYVWPTAPTKPRKPAPSAYHPPP